MKRFFIYFFTYLVVTAIAALVTWGVWTVVNGFSSNTYFDKVIGVVETATPPLAREDRDRTLLKDRWRVTFTQNLKVSYTYKGKKYTQERELLVHTDYYDAPVSPKDKVYDSPYKSGAPVTIFIDKKSPDVFQIEGSGEAKEVAITSVLKFSVPVYALVMILFTGSFIKKEKKLKKERFYKKYGMDRELM